MLFPELRQVAAFSALVLLAHSGSALLAQTPAGAYSQDGIDYRASGPISTQQAERLHQALLAESAHLQTRLELPASAPLRVYIAHNAAAFARATGRNWFVAALYAPDEDRFYFQNPGSLHARGLLTGSVRHELCHRALANLREVQGGARSSDSWLWLEEALCEAMGQTPVSERESRHARESCVQEAGAVHALVRGARELEDFGSALERRLSSRTYAVRRSAFCAAGRFGAASLIRRPAARTVRALVKLQSVPARAEPERAFFAETYAAFRARFVGIERTARAGPYSL